MLYEYAFKKKRKKYDLCIGFNGRIADIPNFIEGIDGVKEKKFIGFSKNLF